MSRNRLARQIAFVRELDKLKTVTRQTLLADGSRAETDAEHSWHVAVMALVLAEYAPIGADPQKAGLMLLIHDVVEIDAGDTFIHDDSGNASKASREEQAARRLYGLLPADQGADLAALWREYEDRQTPTACYADALDRLQPILNNVATKGAMWQAHHVTAAMVGPLVKRIGQGAPALGDYAAQLVAEAVRCGYLRED